MLSFSVLSLIYLSNSQRQTETQACRYPYENTDGQTNIYIRTHTNCTHTLTQTAYLHTHIHAYRQTDRHTHTYTHPHSSSFRPHIHIHMNCTHTHKHIYICIRHTHIHTWVVTVKNAFSKFQGKNVHQFMHVIKTSWNEQNDLWMYRPIEPLSSKNVGSEMRSCSHFWEISRSRGEMALRGLPFNKSM